MLDARTLVCAGVLSPEHPYPGIASAKARDTGGQVSGARWSVRFMSIPLALQRSTGRPGCPDQPFGWCGGRPSAHDQPMPLRIVGRLLDNEFLRFCVVGASGYAVNLAVYAALLTVGLHYLAAASLSFLVAAASNYVWNRVWTFRTSDAPLLGQGARALVVSGLSLGANQLFLLVLVTAGAGHLAAQAAAIALTTPFSFAANKLWAFVEPAPAGALEPVAQAATRDSRR